MGFSKKGIIGKLRSSGRSEREGAVMYKRKKKGKRRMAKKRDR